MIINPEWRSTLFIDSDRLSYDIIDKIIEHGACILGGNDVARFQKKKETGLFFRCVRKIMWLWIRIRVWLHIIFSDRAKWEVFGYEHIWPSDLFLDAGWEFSDIEVGIDAYMTLEQELHRWNSLRFIHWFKKRKYIPGGWADEVKRVYLTGRLRVPAGLEHKVEIINVRERWEQLEPSRRKDIMDIFSFNYDKILELICSGRDCFLLGQNFAPGFISYERQAEIYRDILSPYEPSRVVIKPHPADTMDYKKFFPDCYVLKENFPFELCALVGLPISKVITINSSAVFGMFSLEQMDCHEEYSEIILRESEK